MAEATMCMRHSVAPKISQCGGKFERKIDVDSLNSFSMFFYEILSNRVEVGV